MIHMPSRLKTRITTRHRGLLMDHRVVVGTDSSELNTNSAHMILTDMD